nr:DNA methyltransferase [Sphingobium jiangsuense]
MIDSDARHAQARGTGRGFHHGCLAPGSIILDPFMGSGTTIIAAERCDRRACGVEIEPLFVDRAIRRWQDLTGRQAIHAETGRSFSDIAIERAETDSE